MQCRLDLVVYISQHFSGDELRSGMQQHAAATLLIPDDGLAAVD
jgi:hypothetical protein